MEGGLQHTLSKQERICGQKVQERLFSTESRSMAAFPIRAIYLNEQREEGSPSVRIMASVPKKCFKRAVKRNRVKRQIREAYRKNKHLLTDTVDKEQGRSMLVAFIWMDNKLHPTAEVEKRIRKLLYRLAESTQASSDSQPARSSEASATKQ